MMFTTKLVLDRPLSVSFLFSFTHKKTFWQHYTIVKIELPGVLQTFVKWYKASNRVLSFDEQNKPGRCVLATKKEKLVKFTECNKDLLFCFKLQSREGTK